MTREQFDALVRDVENGIGRDPAALKRHVTWWAFVGYAGFMAGLALVALLAGAFIVPGIYLKSDGIVLLVIGGLILLATGAAMVKALWVRVPPPDGCVVTRDRAPRLFAELDSIQRTLKSAPFHTVLLIEDFNAAVVQTPRLGVLGWWKNYLLIGLPLIESLSEEEFRAVLAHECAHLSRRHGSFGHWLYRLRRSWEQAFDNMHRPRVQGEISFRPLVMRFVDWFWPRFNACAFVYSRLNEYEADRIASQIAGVEPSASALRRIRVFARMAEEKFWPSTWQRANAESSPPADVFARFSDSLNTLTEDEWNRWLQEGLRTVTTNADTHPCLRERLQAIGAQGEGSPERRGGNAARTLLGDSLENLRAEVQAHWAKSAEKVWRERHARSTALHHRLSAIDAVVPETKADVDALWDRARVMIDLQGDAAAEPLFRQVLALRADHAPANFCLGRRLLENGDAAGEALLEKAVEADPELLPQASQHLYIYFRANGQMDRIRELDTRMDRHEKAVQESHRERSSVSAADTMVQHDLTEAELAALRDVLSRQPGVVLAHLARKQLTHFPKQRLFLLCVETRRAWHRLPNRSADEAAARALARSVQLPGRFLVFAAHGGFRAVAKKVRQVPGSQVLP
jgi:hypothetical protein